jgi:Amt family ammonium transporter
MCFFFVAVVKNKFGYDDSLDVFGIHCIGGIIGAIATGILVDQGLGGTGIPDYESKPGELSIAAYELAPAVIAQLKAVCLTLAWSGIGSAILYKVVDLVIGLRVPIDSEREGLDLAEHGERAYNM